MERLVQLVGEFGSRQLPWRPVRVTSNAGWVDEQVNWLPCTWGTMPVQVMVGAGVKPGNSSTIFARPMSSRPNAPWVALPLPKKVFLRRVFPYVVPAFDNTWYKAEYLGIGVAASHPDDPTWAKVLGRRNDGSWEVRSLYPHTAERYALQSGGGLRDTMRVKFELSTSMGGGGPRLSNVTMLTYAIPDDGSDPGLTPNAYTTVDDGATWFNWDFMTGLVDVANTFYNLSAWLKDGGRQFGFYITAPTGSVDHGGTIQIIQITGRHWKHAFVKQLEQITAVFEGHSQLLNYEIIGFTGPAGMTVFEYQRQTGTGGPRTVPLNTWTFTPPEVTDCPWEGRAWLVSEATVGDKVWWLPGLNRDRSPVKIWKTDVTALRGGTPVWSVAVDTTVTYPLDPDAFDDVVLADRNLKFIPQLSQNGVTTGNIWPIHNLLLGTSVPPTNLIDGTEPAFLPAGAVVPAEPHLRWVNTQGFEQFRPTEDDPFSFRTVDVAWTGPDPGAGAQFDGDADGGLTYGPRLYGIYENFDGDVQLIDSSYSLLVDTGEAGQEFAFWGDYAFSRDGAIDAAGEGSKWWDVVPDDDEL